MKEKDSNDTFIEHIHATLETSLDDIDAATQSRITQARYRALEQAGGKSQTQIWLTAGAVATTCIALVVFSLLPETQMENTMPVDDFDLIGNMDNLEMLEELEFYEWLEDHELPT